MPKPMGSGYVTSVLSGLEQVPEPCWASVTFLENGGEFV